MKKIYSLLAILSLAVVTFSSCSNDDPFITASEDDYPKILYPDFGDWVDGKPVEYKSITRDKEYIDSCVVTPSQYTTVEWTIDDEVVAEGTRIQKTLLAGSYTLKIKATTTKGLTTSRTGILNVRALATDPSLASDAKSRWLQIGTNVTVEGKNLEGVTAAYINGVQVTNFVNNGNSITFTVPDMEVGEYNLVLETADMQYGAGKFTVSTEKYVDPGVTEKVIFEGESAKLAWSAWEDLKETWADAGIGVGSTIIVYVTADEGAQGAITTGWWNDINTGAQWEEAGLKTDLSGECTMEYTVEDTKFLEEQGFAVVGNGFVITKVVVRNQGSAAAQTIWEGESDKLAWSAWEVLKTVWADAGIAPGKKITVYVTADEGAQGAITTGWWNDINTGAQWEEAGLKTDLSGDCTLEYTVENTTYLEEQGFAVVGNGFVVKKVTIE